MNIVISTSKIKNNNPIKKRGIENGNTNFEIELKPHSNETFFSEFDSLFIDVCCRSSRNGEIQASK